MKLFPTKKSSALRPLGLLALSLLLLMYCFNYWMHSTMMGGQFSESPNGRYRISIDRKMDPRPGDPYWMTLVDTEVHKVVYKLAIHPIDNFPSQGPRGQDQMIEWAPDSKSAELILDGRLMCRVYTP